MSDTKLPNPPEYCPYFKVLCYSGYPDVLCKGRGSDHKCRAWDLDKEQCKCIPHHYVLNTAGMEFYK